jgi:hypothetical protein
MIGVPGRDSGGLITVFADATEVHPIEFATVKV